MLLVFYLHDDSCSKRSLDVCYEVIALLDTDRQPDEFTVDAQSCATRLVDSGVRHLER